MHIVNAENYGEANDAVRDILMMYVEMAHSYDGFGHGSDVHIRFDPFKFIDACEDGRAYYVDIALLRNGSAIALLCGLYDLWCEEQHLAGHPRSRDLQAALNAGRLSDFADIEAVIREALRRDYMLMDDPWFEDAVVPIYRKYVLEFFRALGASDRSRA